MERKIGISIFALQKAYGDKRALEIAKEIGADAVDFSLEFTDYRNKDCVYSEGDAAVKAYYAD